MTLGHDGGQFSFDDAVVRRAVSVNGWLRRIDDLLDWSAVERVLSPIYSAPVGRSSYPLLTLFKAQLLGQWYGLGDEALEAAIADRLSFRRFVGLALDDRVPDHSTLWRFRDALARHGLAEAAFGEVVRQLETQGMMIKKGTLLDATLVEAQARRPGADAAPAAKSAVDADADWTRQRGKAHFGYKMHAGVDQDTGLIRRAELTAAKVAESEVADRLISGDERAVYADKAYEHKHRRRRLKARGIKDRIMHRSHKNQTRLPPWQARRNRLISPIRSAVERVFGTLKRSYGYHRVRAFSLRANRVHMQLMCIAYNLRRADRLRPATG